MGGIALVRAPGPRLAEGLVTHIERTPVDVALARLQHEAYVQALAANGWRVWPVLPADDCPDAVFVEDTVVVRGDLAVITRPGAPERRPELSAVETAARELGLRIARIEPPGTLDGGDVLQTDHGVYVGLGGRTNAEGIDQLASHLGVRCVPVPLNGVLHLKSAATALADGTVLVLADALDTSLFPRVIEVSEPSGAHVVPLGGDAVLIAATAPRTAESIAERGYLPVVVDISEFERLEGCVTCLNVLVEARG